jgi:PAS domain S-box-containing protein
VENGELRRIWGTTKDITELRRAELSLVAAERLFRHVLEEIKLPAVQLDQSGAITFCNDYLLGLLERPREELSSLNWMEQVVPAEEIQKWKAMLTPPGLGKQSSSHFKGVILDANGVRKEILWSAIIVRDQDGEMTGLAAIGRDIAYQEALKKEIQQAQKLESIGRVVVAIAYGFNSFLAVVLEHVSELLGRATKDDEGFASLCAIQDSITLCVKLTGQLLAFGCKQELQPKSIALNDIIANGEGFIRSLIGRGISLVFDLASPLWPAYADPTQIQKALAKLVTNAREAMPLGGGLTIATSNLVIGDHDTAYPGIKPGPYVRLSVSDNGVGMTEEVRLHIFEPFFTTKTAGSGFGLAAVYGIVTQSGGHITVHSDFRKGTTMNVLLPASIIAPHE